MAAATPLSRSSSAAPAARRLISLTEIDADQLIRRPRRARVQAIAASLEVDGQMTPVEVTPKGDRWSLTKGWVRVEAARFLGRTEIEAVIWRGSAAERHQRQIDDNLLQDGCTALDRAQYLAAGKALYERANPAVRHGGVRRGDQVANDGHLKGFHDWAAERYGMSSRSIRRACLVGDAIAAVTAGLLADTEWGDHQSALEQIARFAPAQQAEIARLITADPPKALPEALSIVGGIAPADPLKKALSAVEGGWGRLGARERRDWLRGIASDLPTGVRIIFDGDA